MSNITFYDYSRFIKDRNAFKTVDYEGINRYDAPSALYYKLVFYFTDESGLLGLDGINGFDTDILQNDIVKTTSGNGGSTYTFDPKTHNVKNTAYNFLLLNEELERAEMLKNFLILLSEINTNSPWYFQEINGLDGALDRKIFSDNEMKIEEKPKQIQIKCLNDAYDDRIGTLLDLYRASCFSYQNKKEIVPRNLRRFNMGVLIFGAPTQYPNNPLNFSGDGEKNFYPFRTNIGIPDSQSTNTYIPSTKLIELRNCEFDYNSAISPYTTLNTTDGPFSPQYTITINFSDCYESRYNEIMQQVVTDFINIDINTERKNNKLEDIKLYGSHLDIAPLALDDVRMPLTKEDAKKLWTDTNAKQITTGGFNNSLTDYKVFSYGKEQPKEKGGFFTTQLDKINEAITKAAELPSLKKNENIHDNGRVNMYGEFEYLNRMNGTNGIAGTLLQQSTGLGAKALRDEVSKLYLGNLYEMSVSNVLEITKRALSGDIAGTVGSIKSKGPKSIAKNTSLTPKEEIRGDKGAGYETPPKKIQQSLVKEIWEDPKQRALGFDPITKEIHDGGVINRNLDKGAILDVDVLNHTMGSEHELAEVIFTTENISENTGKISRPKKMPKRINDPEGSPVSEFVTTEIWTDPIQRDLGFEPITNEIWTDPFQRNIDSNTIGELPGYIKGRTKFLNEMNTKQSIRNNI
jgi:hypothetical protein